MSVKGKAVPTTTDLGLRSDSFSLDDISDRRRVVANVEGLQKCGKTDWCLRDTPDPIVIFNFDQGIEGVIEKHRARGKTIIVAGAHKGQSGYRSYHFVRPIRMKDQDRNGYLNYVQKLAMPMWNKFISDLKEFYESDARTGVIDTAKAAHSLGRFAYVGMDTGKRPTDDPYGQKTGNLNAIFQGLIADGQNYDKNVLWVSRLKEEWVDNQPSGRYKTAGGYNELGYEVQVTLRLKRNRKGEMSVEIRDCRLGEGAEMNGEEFTGKQVKFPTVMALVTGSDPMDWK